MSEIEESGRYVSHSLQSESSDTEMIDFNYPRSGRTDVFVLFGTHLQVSKKNRESK